MRYDGAMALPSWVPDDETKPAPMPLLVVQSFVNTWEGDTGTDLLADPASAGRWLRDAGLLGAAEVDADLAAVRGIREAIRALLVHNAGGGAGRGGDPHAGDIRAAVPSAAGGAGRRQRRRPAGRRARGERTGHAAPDHPRRTARRHLGRLKACRNPDCRWAYYDRSHAGRGAWCDMAVCGNRIKNRNLRSRRTGGTRATGVESRVSHTVRVSIDDKVGTLALDNVAKRNALGAATVQELLAALGDFEERGVRAVVVRTAKLTDVWSAGHDIDELPVRGVDPLPFADPLEELLRAVRGYPGAVIAMVHGTVWGGACDLVLNCDLVVGDETAAFAVTPAGSGCPIPPRGSSTSWPGSRSTW